MCNHPDFMVLGLPKTGTTSLDRTLRRHPSICLPMSKETWFFYDQYERGLDWYRERFFHCKPGQKTGEVTTTNLLIDYNLERIHQHNPDMKIVILLRDPIKRCISNYWHNVRIGEESRTIDQAILEEEKYISESDNPARASVTYGYVGVMKKAMKAIRDVKSIFPEDNVLFVLFEELVNKPENTLTAIESFIGVDTLELRLLEENRARQPRSMWLANVLTKPSNLFGLMHSSRLLNRLVPLGLKRKTRGIRASIGRALRKMPEISYLSYDNKDLDSDLRHHLELMFKDDSIYLAENFSKKIYDDWPWVLRSVDEHVGG